MAEDIWHFAVGDERQGPVSLEELRAQLENGRLQAQDLVWKAGMEDWVEAGSLPELSLSINAVDDGSKGAAGSESSGVEPGTDPLSDAAVPLPHLRLVERLLGTLRRAVSAQRLDWIDRLAKRAGHLAYVGSATLLLIFFVVLSLKQDSIRSFLGALLTIAPAALLAHYIGSRFLDAGTTLIRRASSTISSDAFPTCYGLLCAVGSLSAVVFGVHTLLQEGGWIPGGIQIATGLVLLYVAGAALNLSALNVTVSAGASASEEAISVLMFLVKIPLRLVPFVFGVGACAGLGFAAYFAAHLFSDELPFVALQATATTPAILAVAIIPLAAYLGFLLSHLLIDLLRAILRTPTAIEALGKQ